MKNKLSKQEIQEQIEEFFKDVKNKSSKEIKKIKRLAMSKNIPLKGKRKLFCKKCFEPYKTSKVRIRKRIKSIKCENCGGVGRWKL